MNRLVLCLLALTLNACVYPYFRKHKLRAHRAHNSINALNAFHVSDYHHSAVLRRGSFWAISDTLDIGIDVETMLVTSLKGIDIDRLELNNDPTLLPIIDAHLRWKKRRLLDFLQDRRPDRNTLIPMVCYNASVEPEKSGTGIGPFYETGNDRYHIARELYIVLYNEDGELVYLKNTIQYDEKIVPAGTPITHEFPQEVLDTLMQMALEPLLKRMEKKQ